MKNLKLGISALALTVASTVFAQTANNPWLIGVGAHAENHVAAGGNVGDVFKQAFSGEELYSINNFTITPPLSKLTVARHLTGPLVLDWQTTVGNVDNKKIGMDKEFMLMTGLGLQLKANSLWNEESWFDPYLRVGANYLRHDYSGTGVVNGDGKAVGANHFALATGIGSNFWLTDNFGLGIQGDYVSTPGDKSSVANFFQAGASLLFRFGQSDRDKDGILDKDDLCPDEAGLPEFQGCPDTDGDGVPDKDDQCPDVAGPADNNGCPWPDTDGDGVLDKDDACKTVPGLAEYNGCPKPQEDLAQDATVALTDILFDFDKSTVRAESQPKLDAAAEIIKSSNGGTFLVAGHTDKKGSAAYNLKLSQRRAAAVVKGLEARGVVDSQLKSKGLGESEATVDENASNEERLKDRKVVVSAVDAAAWDAIKKRDY
ncbi:OmpA family protein [Chryseobacterium sp. A301]